MAELVQGLWVGSSLSPMEQISISSFLAQGHEYHLYVYGAVANLPPGTVPMDANEIIPEQDIFLLKEHPSYGGFADFFRYKLLLDKGGLWADTDFVCLRPLQFSTPYVFSSEFDDHGRIIVNNGILKAERNDPLIRAAWSACKRMDVAQIKWGDSGPTLIHNLVVTHGLTRYVQHPNVFCPIPPEHWFKSLLPQGPGEWPVESLTVHLWNEIWRRMGLNKEDTYAPSCLYEHLKSMYLTPEQ